MVIRLSLGIQRLRLKVKPVRRQIKRRGYQEKELWYILLGGSWPGCVSDLRRTGYPAEMIDGEVWFRPQIEDAPGPELQPQPLPQPQARPQLRPALLQQVVAV